MENLRHNNQKTKASLILKFYGHEMNSKEIEYFENIKTQNYLTTEEIIKFQNNDYCYRGRSCGVI